jgi:hypothetical protein
MSAVGVSQDITNPDPHVADVPTRDIPRPSNLIERWWRHYNTTRPHGVLGLTPPAPRTIVPKRVDPPFATNGLRADRRSDIIENGLN